MSVYVRAIDGRSSLRLLLNESIEVADLGSTILVYVAGGQAMATVGDSARTMRVDDVMVVNRETRFGARPVGPESMLFVFEITDSLLSRAVEADAIAFSCNSLDAEPSAAYDELRRIVRQTLNILSVDDERAEFRLYGSVYDLLDCLIANFSVRTRPITRGEERFRSVLRYINGHYFEPLTLSGVASHFHLDSAYFSRYFKKSLGVNFKDYLSETRLFCAERALRDTDVSIARVAMESGFSNVSSFNKAFRRSYGVTPSAYRAEHGRARVSDKGGDHDLVFSAYRSLQEGARKDESELVCVSGNLAGRPHAGEAFGSSIANAGSAWELMNEKIRDHMKKLVREGFQYLRFWDVLDEMPGCPWESSCAWRRAPRQNYDAIDDIFDFLQECQLTPWVVIAVPEEDISGQTFASYRDTLESFLAHVSDRYGASRLGRWRFEISLGGTAEAHRLDRARTMLAEAANLVHRYAPAAEVGGFCLDADGNKAEVTRAIDALDAAGADFRSFRLFSQRPHKDSEQDEGTRPSDGDFYARAVGELASSLRAREPKPLYVTEWGISPSSSNILNDSLYAGANFIRGALALISHADGAGYWVASDWHEAHARASSVLTGGAGMISKHGIAKPTYIAAHFLRDFKGAAVIERGDRSLISYDGDSYRVLFANYVCPNRLYYLKDEGELHPWDVPGFFPGESSKVRIALDGLPRGRYEVRVYSCNSHNGSLLDQWRDLGYSANLRASDIEYLRQKTAVRMEMGVEELDGCYETVRVVEPNEFLTLWLSKKD